MLGILGDIISVCLTSVDSSAVSPSASSSSSLSCMSSSGVRLWPFGGAGVGRGAGL